MTTLYPCPLKVNSMPAKQPCEYGHTGTYCDECGLKHFASNIKLYGGQEAIANSWPSVVLVLFKYVFYYTINGVNGKFRATRIQICGGTLIDRKTVLTAASCFKTKVSYTYNGVEYTRNVETNSDYPTYESMYSVYLGLHDIKGVYNESDIYPAVKMSVSKFIKHPNFESTNYLDDIAILKLETETTPNCFVQTACLPNPINANYPNLTYKDVWAVGWGKINSASYPYGLNNVKLTLYNNTLCNNVSPSLTNKQLCIGEILGDLGTCDGDFGGPLFVKDTINGVEKFVLAGIASYSKGCAQNGLPGIATKVSSYLTWINSNL